MVYGIDDGFGNALSQGLSEDDARRIAQQTANRRCETVYLYEDGVDGSEAIEPDQETLVVLESMPAQHRASHRAAGNFGVWPQNGSTRFVLPLVEAREVVDSDEDKYDHIVRAATDDDIAEIGTDARPEGW